MKKSSLVLFASLLLAGLAPSVHATVLVSSNFDAGYTPGALDGQSGTGDVGFTDTYTAQNTAAEMLNVVSGGLTYSNGSVYIPGGTQSAQLTSTSGSQQTIATRPFSDLTGQTFYMRLVVSNVSAGDCAGSFADLSFGMGNTANNTTSYNRIDSVGLQSGSDGSGQYGSNVAYFYTGAFANSGVTSTANGTHLLVAQFVFNGNPGTPKYLTTNFFLDPTSLTLPATATATATSSDAYGDFNELALSIANLSGTIQFDSFAIGTSYADVVTGVPEPGTWTMLILSALGAAVYASRRRLA